MITATYLPEQLRLHVEGHAGFAEAGKDLVCAAASSLFNTAAQALAMEDAKHTVVLTNEGGDALTYYFGRKRKKAESILNTIAVGYGVLEKQYPDNVRLEVIGND